MTMGEGGCVRGVCVSTVLDILYEKDRNQLHSFLNYLFIKAKD